MCFQYFSFAMPSIAVEICMMYTFPEQHVPGDLRQLRVRQRQRPQAQVRRRVRHAAQHVLDGVDALPHTVCLAQHILTYCTRCCTDTIKLHLAY